MSVIHIFKPHLGKVFKVSLDTQTYLELGSPVLHLSNPKKDPNYFLVCLPGGRLLHRIITKCPTNLVVDHINRNTLDNRLSNLRLCSTVQNARNKGPNKNSTSKFKGVSKALSGKDALQKKVWCAQIEAGKDVFGKRIIRKKRFLTEREAALQYNEWAKELHGEFAVLNDVE